MRAQMRRMPLTPVSKPLLGVECATGRARNPSPIGITANRRRSSSTPQDKDTARPVAWNASYATTTASASAPTVLYRMDVAREGDDLPVTSMYLTIPVDPQQRNVVKTRVNSLLEHIRPLTEDSSLGHAAVRPTSGTCSRRRPSASRTSRTEHCAGDIHLDGVRVDKPHSRDSFNRGLSRAGRWRDIAARGCRARSTTTLPRCCARSAVPLTISRR